MKADAHRQWRLLDLAALDTRLEQIAHRRAHLPEEDDVARRSGERDALDADLLRARTAHDDVRREIDKAAADVQLVRDRADRNRARLDAGTGSAKDLQALQHELASLARRQDDLEDQQLAVMERAEAWEREIADLRARLDAAQPLLAAATAARDAAVAGLDDEEASLRRTRADLAAGVGADLLDLYEKIRAHSGVGAAALRERRCEGCRLELMAADLARIAAAADDDVLRCEECRRILVRTAESGL